jgi:GH24 family phage-related lysozyme (muramidase)
MTGNVGPRAVQLITEFEGAKPRLLAEMCEGGAYELGWGSTYHLDGRPVKAGETATLEYAIALRAHALTQEMAPVWRALQVTPNQNQIDALACLAYNVGGSAAAGSSVVRHLNAGRLEDAAAAFGMWTGSTNSGPAAREVLNGTVPAEPKWDEIGGRLRWLGPDGQPCSYFRRFRGLLRRHHAEGCLFLGLDWKEATKNDAIALRTRLEWNEARGRWEDQIIYQTPFSEVLEVARKYPLAPPAPVSAEPKAPAPLPPAPPEPAPVPKPAPTKPVETQVTTPTPRPAPAPPPKPAPVPYGAVDPYGDPKDMIASKRFWGLVILVFSRISFFGLAGQTWAGEIVGDPILFDAAAAGLAMAALFAVDAGGQALHHWGKASATRTLK